MKGWKNVSLRQAALPAGNVSAQLFVAPRLRLVPRKRSGFCEGLQSVAEFLLPGFEVLETDGAGLVEERLDDLGDGSGRVVSEKPGVVEEVFGLTTACLPDQGAADDNAVIEGNGNVELRQVGAHDALWRRKELVERAGIGQGVDALAGGAFVEEIGAVHGVL